MNATDITQSVRLADNTLLGWLTVTSEVYEGDITPTVVVEFKPREFVIVIAKCADVCTTVTADEYGPASYVQVTDDGEEVFLR